MVLDGKLGMYKNKENLPDIDSFINGTKIFSGEFILVQFKSMK